jgi:ankyrin repeat protein
MSELSARPDLDQLRRRAKELLRAARNGDQAARAAFAAVGRPPTLAGALLIIAREHGFSSWSALTVEVERRRILDARDAAALEALLARHPDLASTRMQHWCDHRWGPSPLSYLALLRYDTHSGRWRDMPGTGLVGRILIAAGAPVDGLPGDPETPLMTAASYGDAELAQVLVDAGADLTATAAGDSGGAPGGTALRHAAIFGMADVARVLVAAGATDLIAAAAAGFLDDWDLTARSVDDRVAALRIAAERGHLDVIDHLLAAGTPVDGVGPDGSTALHEAAYSGRPDSVQHLLSHGADPDRRDSRFHATPLDWSRHARAETGAADGHDAVERILSPLAIPPPQHRTDG